MGLPPLLDSNSLAVTAKQHDSTYSSISAIIVCNTGILFSFSFSFKPYSEIGAGALFGPILRAGEAKNGVPPVMHDLIIFRALFSDSIPLRFY